MSFGYVHAGHATAFEFLGVVPALHQRLAHVRAQHAVVGLLERLARLLHLLGQLVELPLGSLTVGRFCLPNVFGLGHVLLLNGLFCPFGRRTGGLHVLFELLD